MTNFDFLKLPPDFDALADVAISVGNKMSIKKLETL